MIDRFKRVKAGDEAGFTLIELLVVITILGILAAIVVFSVGGVNNKGQDAACKTDTTTLQTAEEAFFAKNTTYAADDNALKNAGFLSNTSTLHSVTGTGTAYTIKVASAQCGTVGNTVGQTANDT